MPDPETESPARQNEMNVKAAPTILAIETTCDETAAAVITVGPRVLSSVVASQAELHEQYRGVVPEIAARAHVERILPVIQQTLTEANLTLDDIDAFAVANEPGLAGALIVGLTAAKTLAMVTGKPLIGINHLHAHIYACQFDQPESVFPCIGLVVSGGHSHLYRCKTALDFELLGGTIDDAAGEAFDKVASMLGLPYPGGPAISARAKTGDAKAYQFPRSFIRDTDRLEFSFSGLKTAVRYAIAGTGRVDFSKLNLDQQTIDNVAASFQQAVVDCLVAKSVQAIEQTKLTTLCVGGGVAANRVLRVQLQEAANKHKFRLLISPMEMCTDNAAMGAIALEKFAAGKFDALDLDIQAGLVRLPR